MAFDVVQDELLRKTIFSLIDLTSLNDTDTSATISKLCRHVDFADRHVAAVCVYPRFVVDAKSLLLNSAVRVATVANFPDGTDALDIVLRDVSLALQHGADEIDVVFPYQAFLRGQKSVAFDLVRECKKICGTNVLKVILETGVLQQLDVIAEVSSGVCMAGADFLKTSTGKTSIGATLEAAEVMLKTIKSLSAPVGLKVSGGVRTLPQALQYIELAQQIMGPTWVTPSRFRIGASQLAHSLLIKP